MSTTKNALVRYLAYDRCLGNIGKRYSYNDLIDEANAALHEEGSDGITKSQFYKDIEFMQVSEWQAPIEKYREGHTVYYRYSDPDFSIRKQPLNRSESESILSAIQVLSRFKGLPQFDWLYEVIPALQEKLGLNAAPTEIISFDSNIDYSGLVWFQQLYQAAVNQQVLKVTYLPFKRDEPLEFHFHIHHLKQYNGRWFAFGLNEEFDNPAWNIALDRIQSLEPASLSFKASTIDWDDHFYDMVGVTRSEGQEPETIRLWISSDRWPYVKTKPLHGSQKVVSEEEDGVIISLHVIHNKELESLLNSFGEDLRVL